MSRMSDAMKTVSDITKASATGGIVIVAPNTLISVCKKHGFHTYDINSGQ